eukprot:m.147056 g.147056  ORF g.147056 m.147056 type:complete len:284 (-) comp13239_c0_seq2:1495-2346(-)
MTLTAAEKRRLARERRKRRVLSSSEDRIKSLVGQASVDATSEDAKSPIKIISHEDNEVRTSSTTTTTNGNKNNSINNRNETDNKVIDRQEKNHTQIKKEEGNADDDDRNSTTEDMEEIKEKYTTNAATATTPTQQQRDGIASIIDSGKLTDLLNRERTETVQSFSLMFIFTVTLLISLFYSLANVFQWKAFDTDLDNIFIGVFYAGIFTILLKVNATPSFNLLVAGVLRISVCVESKMVVCCCFLFWFQGGLSLEALGTLRAVPIFIVSGTLIRSCLKFYFEH